MGGDRHDDARGWRSLRYVPRMERLPALYLGHGAPPLLEDPEWPVELRAWSARLPRPKAILIVSAHWESAPVTVGATTPVPLTYDFYGFPLRYYQMRYDAPGRSGPGRQGRGADARPRGSRPGPDRGLDHGAFVPLMAMYPEADIPVLQMSMPDLDPAHLFALGQRLAPLRDEGVLIIGSGFMTHGLPYIHEYMATGKPGAPAGRATSTCGRARRSHAATSMRSSTSASARPGMPYAHPTVEHFAPLFVALGAATVPDAPPSFTIDGYWYGLAKRSFEVG